jgi:O-antigen/teichoic acid export membrane protein
MSVARKILWNTISQIIGKAIIAVVGVVIIKLITSYLGTAGYGEYTTTFDYLALFAIISDLGLYTIGIREMAKDEKNVEKIIGNIVTVRTVFSIFVISIAGFIAYFIPQYQGSHIPTAVWLAGAAAFLNMMTSIISTVLQVNLKMEYNSLGSVIGKIINLAYIVFAIYILHPGNTDIGFYHIVFAGVVGNLAMMIVTWWYARKYVPIKFQFDWPFIKEVLIKATPYGVALVLNTIYFRIGSFSLSLLRSKVEVGVYGVPMRMLEAVGVIPLYFMNAVLPVLTRAINRKDGSHQRIIQFAYDFLVMGSMPIVAGTFALAYPIVSLVSSKEFLSNPATGFVGSDAVLPILIFALAFSFINSLFGFILVADNRQTKILKRNAIGAALTVILDFTLVPHFGVYAAAVDNVITEGYVAIASYLIAKHYIKFKINFKNTFKIAFCAIVMGVTLKFLEPVFGQYLQNKAIFLLIPVGAAIYAGMLYITKTITPEMLALIRKPKSAPAAAQKEMPGDQLDL